MLKPEMFDDFREKLFNNLMELSHEYRPEPFLLKSGAKSHHYVDCRQTALNTQGQFYIGLLFVSLLERYAPTVQAIGGLSIGADPLVSATLGACQTRLHTLANGFYVRPEAKDHGKGGRLVGGKAIPQGASVAICDDVITSGGSMLEAVAAAREAGFRVPIALALVDRQEQGGLAKIQAEVPQVILLYTLKELATGTLQSFPHF